MIYQVGKKQCSISGRKQNDIAPLESDFMVQPPSLLEFPGPLTPPPPWNFQFPPWWGSGYFLELHNCKLRTRLSDIVLHLHIHNNYHQIVTQQVQKRFFYNVILKCFLNHRRGNKRCKFFSFSSKWFGNLKKDVVDKQLVNSVKYYYLSLRKCEACLKGLKTNLKTNTRYK